ncbi:ADP-ribosylglycohydrolase family protein [Mycolicibacterium sediminis]|uniref:ADP-ribosylglycohydrolase n=1 Tax=Mycolicibacterium sediminis TaxID=1286180 RepID=A0A7I7QWH6_9MYCO|nr:ADP-ribosylglycohydrolase family protein [Mycolicibacterium sediminis]BBY30681.1 ADP-ribosylglycohydrolase [Mycolicibacterium sediminis]
MTLHDRALAALRGLALGDALGMPTQSLSRETILEDYGPITGFVDAGPRQRIAAGMPAASITDDTEQAVLLAELLIEGAGTVDTSTFATRLLAWERKMKAKGSLDLLGPSTKFALEQLNDGVPAGEAGSRGATNGAAMRVTPIGIANDVSDVRTFVDAVVAASEVTHNTSLGIASAAAVGAAVSAGVGGASMPAAIDVAISAAVDGEGRGHWVAGGTIAGRLRWAIPYLADVPADDRDRALAEVIGTSVAAQESVVAALALAAVSDDPWRGICQAASLGGDTDTVAAIAGAVLGATTGSAAWPPAEVHALETINDLHFSSLAHDLLALRA